ncbi:MAG: class I SAM-dependent methyltransferase [Synechocystis sp.]|nr:class I SAM-dependent methyltransferase [Synechocystis sp.]
MVASNPFAVLTDFLPSDWQQTLYQGQQNGKAAFSLAHKNLHSQVRQLLNAAPAPQVNQLSQDILNSLTTAREELLAEDWQDSEAGIYPKSLLFDDDWLSFAQYYPQVWLDKGAVWQKIRDQSNQQFAPEIDLSGYPDYYLQNFHHQTDGYLGEMSANLYDLQVELLFNGTSDAMRRRILKPLKQALGNNGNRRLTILDLACGTGRTLKFLAATFPLASLHGLDLSPTYLRKAQQVLNQAGVSLPQLLQGNGEALPYQDNLFDLVTNVYLLHELPAPVRQTVLSECFRVLKPGGILMVMDSIQVKDRPEWEPMLENFPQMFHEPYYRHYIKDDITAYLTAAGFGEIEECPHCFSKSWLAVKPA